MHPAKNLTKFLVSPPNQSGFDRSEELSSLQLDEGELQKQIVDLQKQMSQLSLHLEQIQKPPISQNNPWKLYLLGTGAAIPSKYRNVTGMILQFSESQSVFLDAGEGSFGQLTRIFPPNELKKVN